MRLNRNFPGTKSKLLDVNSCSCTWCWSATELPANVQKKRVKQARTIDAVKSTQPLIQMPIYFQPFLALITCGDVCKGSKQHKKYFKWRHKLQHNIRMLKNKTSTKAKTANVVRNVLELLMPVSIYKTCTAKHFLSHYILGYRTKRTCF